MATLSIGIRCNGNDEISQGDVFRDIKYTYIDSEDDNNVHIVEFTFPYAIVISQACDVIAMEQIVKDKVGKATKFMPSILMCPFFEGNTLQNCNHVENVFEKLEMKLDEASILDKNDLKVSSKDWHYRFHKLEIKYKDEPNPFIENHYIDFKQYFTVPMSYLVKNKSNRLCKLDNLFAEQLTLKFATFLTRVAIPDDKNS